MTMPAQTTEQPTAEVLSLWLVEHLAEALDLSPAAIDVEKDFTEYGLNSIEMVGITGELEDFLGCRLDPTLVLSYPNIRCLADHLAQVVREQDAALMTAVNAEQLLANLDQMSDEDVDGLLTTLLAETKTQDD